MSERVVGVLGGMGPEATIDFISKVVALTPAHRDQDHLRIIVDNNPKIPDRTQAILTGDRKIVEVLVETGRNLERSRVDFIAIPCNTVHYYYDDLAASLSVPVLHMIREVVAAIRKNLPGCHRVGLLATTGTVTANLYQKECQHAGIQVLTPDTAGQDRVMEAVVRIKSGLAKSTARRALLGEARRLIEQQAQALILGCTDIPLVIKKQDFTIPVFDSNQVLAEATVEYALRS